MTYLTFCDRCPHWLRRLVRRWYRRLQMDWRVSVELTDDDDLSAGSEFTVQGRTLSLPTYRTATMWLSEDLQAGDDTEHIVLHELRHAHYEAIIHLLNQCWDGRKKMDKETATRMMRDLIEGMIEADVKVLLKLAGK